MTLHKLTAGSGYDYLTRQVAAQDGTPRGRASLSSYYAERGESPGWWVGSGLVGLNGLRLGDIVTEEQMQSLFGRGEHPLAAQRRAALPTNATALKVQQATRLGTPFRLPTEATDFAGRVAVLMRSLALEHPLAERAQLLSSARTQIARNDFTTAYGRDPDRAELTAAVIRATRPPPGVVAGFDLAFSPVKSVSVLWALAPTTVAAVIETAHRGAVADALRLIEQEALFTRAGAGGVRHLEVTGLIGTAFTHRESRAGDPDLHTHVAVANKVQAADGRWRAIDGRVLYAAAVAASETYNTALERRLGESMGWSFTDTPAPTLPVQRKRPVREVNGVPASLLQAFSKRRAAINARRDDLTVAFERDHGRPPTPVEAVRLAQTATLETRDKKPAPRTIREQRSAWHHEAEGILGRGGIEALFVACDRGAGRRTEPGDLDHLTADLGVAAIASVQQTRATWSHWHVRAEVSRLARSHPALRWTSASKTEDLIRAATGHALGVASVALVAPPVSSTNSGPGLQRSDGESIYEAPRGVRFTSREVMAAEARLMQNARLGGGRVVPPLSLQSQLSSRRDGPTKLNGGQAALVRSLATSGARVQLAIAPAGSGKTTAIAALAELWREDGGTVLGLAPSAAAAQALGEALRKAGARDVHTDTTAKLAHLATAVTGSADWFEAVNDTTLVIIDEAGMTGTVELDAVVATVLARGASVRLVGDDRQLSAVGAGGVLADLRAEHGAVRLDELVRFVDPDEAAASLWLREGRPEALGFHLDRERIHVGSRPAMLDALLEAWAADVDAGRDVLMLAPSHDIVAELNRRARAVTHHRSGVTNTPVSVRLADGNDASVGDRIVTRHNDRRLRAGSGWVRNGDRWELTRIHGNPGSERDVDIRHTQTGRTVRLPASYVREWTQLGYASTTHGAQGVTADTTHAYCAGNESRQSLYTMLTRGRVANHLYLVSGADAEPHEAAAPYASPDRTATEMLEAVLARDDSAQSATSVRNQLGSPATSLHRAAIRYADGLILAAEHSLTRLHGPTWPMDLDQGVAALVPGIEDAPAWPTLRAQLVLYAAHLRDPLSLLAEVMHGAPLTGARDRAAVLSWRVDGPRDAGAAPLPWLTAVPPLVAGDPTWSPYLRDLADAIRTSSSDVSRAAQTSPPCWGRTVDASHVDATVLADIAVWRAAHGVADTDPRLTGPPARHPAAVRRQRQLEAAAAPLAEKARRRWTPQLEAVAPGLASDPMAPQLAQHLDRLTQSGQDAAAVLTEAAMARRLPVDHRAGALWWRLTRSRNDVVTAARRSPVAVPAPPGPGPTAADSKAEPTGILRDTTLLDAMIEDAERLAWRPPPPTEAAIREGHRWMQEWDRFPMPRERMIEINQLTQDFFARHFGGSWAQTYLAGRLRCDITGHELFSPGHAPRGWTTLVSHLRSIGVTDEEMTHAGVARVSSNGRVIDRFRDRLTFPIRESDSGAVLAFVARRNPNKDDDGPRYLNSPTTPLFHKDAQLFGQPAPDQRTGAPLVVAEGPVDAVAISVGSMGSFVGLSPLGPRLSERQLDLIARASHQDRQPVLVVADDDVTGRAAGALNAAALETRLVATRLTLLTDAKDAAELLERRGPAAVTAALVTAVRRRDNRVSSPAGSPHIARVSAVAHRNKPER